MAGPERFIGTMKTGGTKYRQKKNKTLASEDRRKLRKATWTTEWSDLREVWQDGGCTLLQTESLYNIGARSPVILKMF